MQPKRIADADGADVREPKIIPDPAGDPFQSQRHQVNNGEL